MDQDEAATVRFVVASRSGVTFRDGYGLGVLTLARATLTALDAVETAESTYLRIQRTDGDPIEFWLDGIDQGEGLTALDAALGRTP